MAKVTRITTQKKKKNRYNIFLDHGNGEVYGFSVDEDILIEFHLHKGQEIDEAMAQMLIEKDETHKIYTLAINYLSYRMRSIKEMRDYLIGKEFQAEQVDLIIDRLLNEKLLNDRQFADAFVRTRIHTSSKGPLLVKRELMDKGVAASIAASAIKVYAYQDQYDKAHKWVSKKLSNGTKKSFKQQIQALQQTLMQKGFTQDVIQEVTNEIEQETSHDAEWEALVYQGEKLLRKHERKVEGFELKHKIKAGLYRKGFNFDLIEQFLDEYVRE
ncbi:recombination regulator RecX [Aquibacillus sediminis]|uniref:recombination regulator RecX n=1 Tax=Aquibacillus sediminis TaxID=2574734 RepID=UPI001109F5D1|nr:recombination regulator RecX [Aquibacillus sediminis]